MPFRLNPVLLAALILGVSLSACKSDQDLTNSVEPNGSGSGSSSNTSSNNSNTGNDTNTQAAPAWYPTPAKQLHKALQTPPTTESLNASIKQADKTIAQTDQQLQDRGIDPSPATASDDVESSASAQDTQARLQRLTEQLKARQATP